MRTLRVFPVVALVALAGALPALASHFSVVKSEPAAKQELDRSPETVTVWFNQVPAAGVSRLRLVTGTDPENETEVEIGRTTIAAGEMSLSAPVRAPLAPGAYRLLWRGAGDDGHVMEGAIPFVVTPASVQ